MLLYNFWLAWLSARRTPLLSLLIITGIALGVAVSTTFITVQHLLSADPLPHKSDTLYYVRMDSWDPAAPHPNDSGIPPQLSYRDARAAMASPIPTRTSVTYRAELPVYPATADQRPFAESIRMATADFFPMLEVPFRFGGPWDRAADAKPEAVVVISSALNDKLFGGRDSTGEPVRIGRGEFRVVGVLGAWRPRLRFYDMTSFAVAEPENIFLPFNWVEPMEIGSRGNRDNWTTVPADASDNFAERLAGTEMTWLQMWVELPTDRQREDFQAFLNAYTADQKRLGRFQRPLDNRLTTLPDLMAEWQVVPPQATALAVISVLFLVVAALNLIGLFLGKFLARAPVVGVRRALGASRGAIFLQHLIECEAIGLVGGALGLLLSVGALALLSRAMATVVRTEGFFALDGPMVLAAIGLSLVAGGIAGIYPSWRICALPPAQHLKNQ